MTAPVERFGEPETVGEMVEPWLGSRTVVAMFTASVPPGVLWHCRYCRAHEKSTSLVMRPQHCGEPMEIDDWRPIFHYFAE